MENLGNIKKIAENSFYFYLHDTRWKCLLQIFNQLLSFTRTSLRASFFNQTKKG